MGWQKTHWTIFRELFNGKHDYILYNGWNSKSLSYSLCKFSISCNIYNHVTLKVFHIKYAKTFRVTGFYSGLFFLNDSYRVPTVQDQQCKTKNCPRTHLKDTAKYFDSHCYLDSTHVPVSLDEMSLHVPNFSCQICFPAPAQERSWDHCSILCYGTIGMHPKYADKLCWQITTTADHAAAATFPAILKEWVQDYHPEQIYNADETGLYYKMLPQRTLAVKTDVHKTEGFKASKERLTPLFTVNKTGSHKLKPLCIGKFGKPRCFHHVNMNMLPLKYSHSKNAWMTGAIFADWFHHSFIPDVRNPRT